MKKRLISIISGARIATNGADLEKKVNFQHTTASFVVVVFPLMEFASTWSLGGAPVGD